MSSSPGRPVLTLTFNRPEARNALTWAMYERLHRTCGQAFVAGTDIARFSQGVRTFIEKRKARWTGQ